jgi:hypothetical protein
METPKAAEIIRALADGRDPVTGEQFPPNSPYQQADTVRALFLAVDALDNSARRARRQALRPEGAPQRPIDPNRPKIGASWSPEEEQQLRDAFAAHKPIPEIAAAHGRTQGAITARLVKLGLIEAPATNHASHGNRPAGLPPSPIRQNRLPSEASAQEGPTRHGVAPERSRVPSDSSAPRPTPPRELTQAEKDDLPF